MDDVPLLPLSPASNLLLP